MEQSVCLELDENMLPEETIFQGLQQGYSLIAHGEDVQGLLLHYPDAYLEELISREYLAEKNFYSNGSRVHIEVH